ncbi:protein of unknown function DUF1971 [[Leptolyngbya] sp. PCC 7376]|uniref:DUF1971 domain-containing protein n=1 Tax=[Leptolyngbya] sp. PCC 7376 TaxID=111781 RepID=UPI00029F4433|nr:DUF1971 domain-containing protein [[Leptolyngbya] sp. PCC 7376]AFY40010.1 protein of unknown function DUF1971 [[Leptolyngbya] sp. PCC 7376]
MLKALPDNLVAYKRTPEFTKTSIPQGLLHSHSTKAEVWGKIVVLAGELTYRILEPTIEEILLTPTQFGIVEPTIHHEVVPYRGVCFYVEFYRDPLPHR